MSLKTWKKRIAWRAHHRGIKEMDVIVGRFVDRHLAHWGEDDLEAMEKILEIPDQVLLMWVLSGEEGPGEDFPLLETFLKQSREKALP